MGIIKPSYDSKRQILGEILPLKTPFTVIIDTSERCNFQCNYCFRSNPDKKMWGYAADNQIMTMEMFDKIIDQLSTFPEEVKVISLSNHGEPLCNPKLPLMIRMIHDRGIFSNISIHTNASLLKGKMLSELIEANPGRIVVSIQGLKDDDYFRVCGYRVNVQELINNLRFFYYNKKDTKLYIKTVDVALRNNDEQLFYDIFLPISDRVYIEKTCDIWKGNDENNMSNDKNITHNKYGDEFIKQLVCPVMFHTMVISPNGDVYPCTQLAGQKKLGNIKDITLFDMWNGKIRLELLREQLTHVKETGACVGCGIKSNSFFTAEDLIDDYRNDVLERLDNNVGQKILEK